MKLKLKSSHRVVDENNRIIMAEGRMELLETIDATGSINQAAKVMKMSYKSAWSKIRSTEAHLKTKIVHSDKSKGTRLTSAGRELLNTYKQMKTQCISADDLVFNTYFQDSGNAFIIQMGRVPPIVSFVGHSGSGKTTFIEKLIPRLTARGIKVAIIKHDVHGFEMDKPGKDTWRHKQAGAVATIISSADQVGLVADAEHDHQPHELVPLLGRADLVITEGYKQGPYPKVEVFRPDATGDTAALCLDNSQLIAIVSDEPLSIEQPVFGLDDIDRVAEFIQQQFNLQRT